MICIEQKKHNASFNLMDDPCFLSRLVWNRAISGPQVRQITRGKVVVLVFGSYLVDL